MTTSSSQQHAAMRAEELLGQLQRMRGELGELDAQLEEAYRIVEDLRRRRDAVQARMGALQDELLESAVRVQLRVPLSAPAAEEATPGFERNGRHFEILRSTADPGVSHAVAQWTGGEDRKGVRSRLVEVLADEGGGPVSARRLLEAVAHLSATPNAAQVVLGELVREGALLRPERGFYSLPRPQDLGFDDEGREVEM